MGKKPTDAFRQDPQALWIGDQLIVDQAGTGPQHIPCDQIPGFTPVDARWDVAILDETALQTDPPALITLISRLRDVYARRTIVLVGEQSSLDIDQLIALGFHAMADYPDIYYHDLIDYKQTPDWLNSQYWANPENWNKFRW